MQAPLKQLYREVAESAVITLSARGSLAAEGELDFRAPFG